MRSEQKQREAIRRKNALGGFIKGQSWEQIASECGFKDANAARNNVSKSLAAHPDPDMGMWRATQTARYNDLLTRLAGRVKTGDKEAIAETRQILTRLDRIHSLETAPTVGLLPGQKIQVEISRDRKSDADQKQL